MITSLGLSDFKSFANERLRLGPFTVIAGANASGKSNIRDALRFLHGVGRGYTLAEILGGKYGPGGEVQWDGIRGAPNEVVRIGKRGRKAENGFALEVQMQLQIGAADLMRNEVSYKIRSIEFSGTFHAARESLQHDDNFVCNSRPTAMKQRKHGRRIATRSGQPVLTQLREHRHAPRLHKEQARAVSDSLASMRFLDPSPNRMREPSFPGQTTLGDRGDNLPTVLEDICDDPQRRRTLIDWTRELTSLDIVDFEFPRDPVSRKTQLRIAEGSGRRISAHSASDGTLRFLAILATLLARDQADLYFVKEINSGIHPSRLHLLVELIENWTVERGAQVVTTTHSPMLLAMVGDETFKNTAVVCRRPDTGDALIRQVADLPNVEKLRASQGLGTLHASRWLEDAVFLSESPSGTGA